ncbi:MAG: hypothetical protein H6657_22885 [Ardenticatenaceae bacterium]|nr:hypothetical protein [Ardenticatenaceae bacterium]
METQISRRGGTTGQQSSRDKRPFVPIVSPHPTILGETARARVLPRSAVLSAPPRPYDN